MKPIDKKDLPKLIAMIVLSVALAGYTLLTVVAPSKAKTPGKKPESAETIALAASATSSAAAAAQAAGDPAALGLKGPSIGLLTAGKDPFVPNGSAAADKSAVTLAPKPPLPPSSSIATVAEKPAPSAAAAAGRLERLLGLPGSYPRSGLPPGGWSGLQGENANPGNGSAAATVAAAPVAPMAVPPPAFTVTGVVLGADAGTKSIAILRGGEGNERRFVAVGDPVGNGFVVAAVHAAGVDIKSGSRRVTMKIGKIGD